MGVKRTRLQFERDFTQIPNAWMRDPKLSRRAKGLLAEITTHSAGWRITIASLVASGPEGRDAIVTTINELRDKGYLVRSQSQGERGRFKEVEYELCDPSTATGFSGSGESEPADDELSTGSTATGFTGSGSAATGPAATGESAPKEHHLEEHHLEEHQGGTAVPPTPFCSRHPNGSKGRPCRSCGDARRRYDAALRAPVAIAPPARRYDPDIYCEHLQLRAGHCDACEQDARKALEHQFGLVAS